MTFIVSAGNVSAIAFATDTLVYDGAGNTTVDEKLFILDKRLSVASWGSGPPGVPTKIACAQIGTCNAQGAAGCLAGLFAGVTSPHKFGLYIAGVECGTPVLWHVDIPDPNGAQENLVTQRDPLGLQTRAVPPNFPFPPLWQSPILLGPQVPHDELVRLAEERVRQAGNLDPRVKGLKSVLVTGNGAVWRTV